MTIGRTLLTVAGMTLALGACGSGGTDVGAEGDETTATEGAVNEVSTTQAEPEGEAEQPAQGASEIDWATVDLTTIDWATIDMSQVDHTAIRENPTASNLDDETIALIGSRMNPGSATLVIGDQTWEFDSFLCAFGHGATQSDVYSFSSDARGDHEGARVQMQANIRDESGEGRYEGADLTHQVYIEDIDNFSSPSINFEFTGPEGITIEGNTLTADGLFDDQLTTDTIEEIPGNLDATCGDGSRR
ncbi:MAG TPA: hypothetical protein VGK83_06830 [Acidimicrobiia bacterium]